MIETALDLVGVRVAGLGVCMMSAPRLGYWPGSEGDRQAVNWQKLRPHNLFRARRFAANHDRATGLVRASSDRGAGGPEPASVPSQQAAWRNAWSRLSNGGARA